MRSVPGPKRAGFRQELQRLLLVVEKPPGDLQQFLALRRQADLLLVPVEEEEVVFLLQLADLIGDRRLGQVQLLGRAGKAAGNGDIVEGTELDVAHGRGFPTDIQMISKVKLMDQSKITILHMDRRVGHAGNPALSVKEVCRCRPAPIRCPRRNWASPIS